LDTTEVLFSEKDSTSTYIESIFPLIQLKFCGKLFAASSSV